MLKTVRARSTTPRRIGGCPLLLRLLITRPSVMDTPFASDSEAEARSDGGLSLDLVLIDADLATSPPPLASDDEILLDSDEERAVVEGEQEADEQFAPARSARTALTGTTFDVRTVSRSSNAFETSPATFSSRSGTAWTRPMPTAKTAIPPRLPPRLPPRRADAGAQSRHARSACLLSH